MYYCLAQLKLWLDIQKAEPQQAPWLQTLASPNFKTYYAECLLVQIIILILSNGDRSYSVAQVGVQCDMPTTHCSLKLLGLRILSPLPPNSGHIIQTRKLQRNQKTATHFTKPNQNKKTVGLIHSLYHIRISIFLLPLPGPPAKTESCSVTQAGVRVPPHLANLFVSLVEMGFCHVGQAGFKLLISSDLPTSASQSAGITGGRSLRPLNNTQLAVYSPLPHLSQPPSSPDPF
ncbi:Protein GVQW1 [Plecturocebus cupreus]